MAYADRDQDVAGPSRSLSFGSPQSQRRIIGSPYSYSQSPPWTREQPLPPPSSEESTYTPTSPWATNSRPPLNPLNNPLIQPISRFSLDTQPALASQPHQRLYSDYTAVPVHSYDQADTPPTQIARPRLNSSTARRKWWKYVPIILLDIVIAVTVVCLAGLLSMLVGHLIFRVATRPSPAENSSDAPNHGPYDSPIIPSIQAGVLGGAVLSLPIAITVKLLFPPRDDTPSPTADDDFVHFDSYDGQHPRGRGSRAATNSGRGGVRETTLTRYQAHKVFALLFCECVGVAAGPIGVLLLRECYAGHADWDPHAAVRLLDPLHAVQAGAVGGAIIGPSIIFLVWLAWKIWTECFMPQDIRDDRTINGHRRSWYF